MQISQSPQLHQRVNASLLSAPEKKVLNWIAARLPAWVTPDILTGLGVFASVLIGVSFYLTNFSPAYLWLASFGLVLNWFGDSLDGTLARYRKIERPLYGFFVDHAVDSLDEAIVFIGIGLSPYVDFNIAMLTLVGYLLLSINVFLYTYVKGVFRISFARLGPTEVRILIIIVNAIMFFIGNPVVKLFNTTIQLYDVILAFFAALFIISFIVISIARANELSKLDTARQQQKAEKAARKQQRKMAKRKSRAVAQTEQVDQ